MSKEEAVEWIKKICAYLTSGNPVWRNEPIIEACGIAIKAITTEPKVLCKRCIYWDRKNVKDGFAPCNENNREGLWQADDYCSWGERGENG